MTEYYSVTKEEVIAQHEAMKEFRRQRGITSTSAEERQTREIDEMKRLSRRLTPLYGNVRQERKVNDAQLFHLAKGSYGFRWRVLFLADCQA